MDYYRTPEGKLKKKAQNDKRGEVEAEADLGGRPPGAKRDLVLHECKFDMRMAGYVRMVTSLIEGRRVRVVEILEMLARAVRQHSMVRRRRIDYVLQHLNKHAP